MITVQALCDSLKASGIISRVVPVTFLEQVQERMEQNHQAGTLPAEVYKNYFSRIDFEPDTRLFGSRSIIVAAVPLPGIKNRFHWQGRQRTFVIPPTFTGEAAWEGMIKESLGNLLGAHGYSIAPASLPDKYLAVCCGLGEYGRNNICYVPGLGSFHGLFSFYTDMPSEKIIWREPVMMESCHKCEACVENCPTGAISGDRFQTYSGRCLTYFNENPGEYPNWVKGSWFDSLVGCMRCQNICPENAAVMGNFVAGESFSEEETALLLSSPAASEVPAETRAKLERLDLFDMEIIPRNLRVLLQS